MGDKKYPFNAEFLVDDALKPHPERIERPLADEAAMIDFSHRQFRGRDGDLLVGARGAVIGAESEINEEHVQSEEAEYRPSAERHEDDAGDKAQTSQAEHKDEEALWTKRTMRRDDRRKDFRVDASLRAAVIVVAHRA